MLSSHTCFSIVDFYPFLFALFILALGEVVDELISVLQRLIPSSCSFGSGQRERESTLRTERTHTHEPLVEDITSLRLKTCFFVS